MNLSSLKKSRLLSALAIFALVSAAATIVSASTAPAQVVLALIDKVKQVKKADPDENIQLTEDEKVTNNARSMEINRMIDLSGIAAYTLQKHWQSLDEFGRDAYIALFTELLMKVAYPNAGHFLLDLDVSVRKEKKRRKSIMVYTSVIHEEEGRIDIDFKLILVDNEWLLRDVYLDGVSLVRNLRTQCLKIIRENSYEELLNRMRTKIEEADTATVSEVTGR